MISKNDEIQNQKSDDTSYIHAVKEWEKKNSDSEIEQNKGNKVSKHVKFDLDLTKLTDNKEIENPERRILLLEDCINEKIRFDKNLYGINQSSGSGIQVTTEKDIIIEKEQNRNKPEKINENQEHIQNKISNRENERNIKGDFSMEYIRSRRPLLVNNVTEEKTREVWEFLKNVVDKRMMKQKTHSKIKGKKHCNINANFCQRYASSWIF